MPKINGLKIRPAQIIGTGVTQMKSLAELGLKKPEHLDKMVTRIWAENYGPAFSNLIDKYAKVMTFEAAEEYTWDLIGNVYKNIPVIEVRLSDGSVVNSTTGNSGAFGEPVQFVFPEKYFAKGELLLGPMNELYAFRIIGDPVMEGSNAVYTAILMGNAYESGCPNELLMPGTPFSYGYSPVEDELSRRVGDIRKAVPTKMRNGWTTIRKDKKFTGAADVQQKMCCTLPLKVVDENNKVQTKNVDSWFTYEEWVFFNEWRKEKNEAELWARDNRTASGNYVDFGDSGNVIRMSNGLMAQMEPGQTIFYTKFSIKDFANQLYSIFEHGNVPFSERKIVVVTGQRGMIMVNESIRQETSGFLNAGYQIDMVDAKMISSKSTEVNSNSLTFNPGQYTKYVGANGLEIEFVCDMSLDDPVRNKINGFDGQGKLSSYAFYCFDMGSKSNPNMYRCKLTNSQYSDSMRYSLGLRNPWGIKSNIISSDEDASWIHTITSLGACILDPSRCLRYLPVGLVA